LTTYHQDVIFWQKINKLQDMIKSAHTFITQYTRNWALK